MKSSILITRICRVLDTAGAANGGAALATEYATAVQKLNERLEQVLQAETSGQLGEAVRMMSDDPPIVEEISALDFYKFNDWKRLCKEERWTLPPSLDKNLIERAVRFSESRAAVKPYLDMYVRAMRVNNPRQAVKALRRLADIDTSQDWKKNLSQSERQLQKVLVNEFMSAMKSGSADAMESTALELLDGVWLEPPSIRDIASVKSWRDSRDAAQRESLGKENIELLSKCRDEKWDLDLVLSILRSIDDLTDKGWRIPANSKELIDGCRRRSSEEVEQQNRERRWKELCEGLHSAIQRGNPAEVREALSPPEFLDHEPPEDLVRQAEDVIAHAEAARRRKTMQICVFSFLAILGVLSVSAWWLRVKMFDARCVEEAANLAFLEKKEYAIERMSAELARVKADEPDVYSDVRVVVFEGRLKTLIENNLSRTNELAGIIAELESAMSNEWKDSGDSISEKLSNVEKSMTKEDGDYRKRFVEVKKSWLDHQDQVQSDRKKKSTAFLETLVAHLETVSKSLRSRFADAELVQDVANCKTSLEEWKKEYAADAAEHGARLAEAERAFYEAEGEQNNYQEGVKALSQAETAVEVLKARQRTCDSFVNFAEVKHLAALDFDADMVEAILSGATEEQKSFSQTVKRNNADFKAFIEENVLAIKDYPAYYSAYGLLLKNSKTTDRFVAVSVKQVEVSKPSYETSYKFRGEMLVFSRQKMADEVSDSNGARNQVLLPSSIELRRLVDLASGFSLTATEFENEILKIIDGHISAAHKKNYLENQKKMCNQTMFRAHKGWTSPYRAVHLISLYLGWLKDDLNLAPNNAEFDKMYRDAQKLGQQISVDGVESLYWLCMWDSRVKDRTMECARWLASIPENFSKRYRLANNASRALREVANWQIEFAGKVRFDPSQEDPSKVLMDVGGVEKDHPLYLLRKVGGVNALIRAFEPGKDSAWRRCADAKGDYRLGEPLYHVKYLNGYIDVEKRMHELSQLYKGSWDQVRKNIPLYGKGR